MENKSTLYAIEEPAEPQAPHVTRIHPHAPAEAHPVAPPSPPQNDWRDLQRRLEKSQAERRAAKTGKL